MDTKSLRKALGLTQEGFGQLVGVSIVTVSRWENGHDCPSRLALKALNNVEDMFNGTQPAGS